jgi:hypothetical protein
VIENIPYTYAIPMLTGWELSFDTCAEGDRHVKEIGMWIDAIHYEKSPGTPGTLRYTLSSTLNGGADVGHKVTVLGLKPVPLGEAPSRREPDLVPFSPLGTDPTAYCRIEQGGRLLRVTVKNQGNEDAGASKTTVTFGTIPATLDTPPISAGGSVDLLFDVPAGCFSPDCSFKITVDSNYQVNEFSEGNNSAGGGCIG